MARPEKATTSLLEKSGGVCRDDAVAGDSVTGPKGRRGLSSLAVRRYCPVRSGGTSNGLGTSVTVRRSRRFELCNGLIETLSSLCRISRTGVSDGVGASSIASA